MDSIDALVSGHGAELLFRDVVEKMTGHSIYRATEEQIGVVNFLAQKAIEDYNSGDIYPGRPNEFGNHMENFFRSTVYDGIDLNITSPPLSSGRTQTTGYPDRQVISEMPPFYLEIKVLKEGSEFSTFRTFYFSPPLSKITRSCPHILVGLEHMDKVLTGNYHVKDLYDMTVKIKAEFNTSNRYLYS